ncbi:MAG: SLBB domain-containing protein [Armatimonadetes bacterium]|nr:SLBB domain-containing protein [Armatimonadota bacterium]MDW8121424.1 SLBB domain-containing protein [Armatimonadota bacterium]
MGRIRLLYLLTVCLVASGWVGLAAQDRYRLQPGDILTVTVLGEPDLTGELLVDPDGFIRLPLVGSLLVAGFTLDDVQSKLSSELSKYLRQPRVSVALKQMGPLSRRVYVLGEVKTPGAFLLPLGGQPTLLDAIGLAGGLTDRADTSRIRLIRSNGQSQTLDLRATLSPVGVGPGLVGIGPGDLIWVPKAFITVTAIGAVAKGGLIQISSGGSLLEAISAAGGVTDPAAIVKVFRGGVEVLRSSWTEVAQEGFPGFPIQEGDTVLVVGQQALGITLAGSVREPGVYDLGGNPTLLTALSRGGPLDLQTPLKVRLLRAGHQVVEVVWDPTAPTPIAELSTPLRSGDLVLVEPFLIRATLVGPVSKPGTHFLRSGATLLDLLAKGENIGVSADLSSATLVRKEQSRQVDLLKILWEGELDANEEVHDGDVLIIPTARKVWVVGAVNRPGSFDYLPNMTAVDAIATAGGPVSAEVADLSAVQISSGTSVRTVNLEQAFRGGPPPIEPIRPGDVIVVPERAKAYVYGGVLKPGAVRVEKGSTVLTILSQAGGPVPDARLDESFLVRVIGDKPVLLRLDLDRALKRGDLSQAPQVLAGDVLFIPTRRRTDPGRIIGLGASVATALFYLSRIGQ